MSDDNSRDNMIACIKLKLSKKESLNKDRCHKDYENVKGHDPLLALWTIIKEQHMVTMSLRLEAIVK
jgi:hypothetical protein